MGRSKGNTPPIKITPDMCPDPNMHILMADGSQKRAGDLVVGDLVKTYHEKDLEKASKKSLVLALGNTEKYSQLREQLENSYTKPTLGEYKVEFVDIIKDVKKIKLTFEGSEIICSLSHKFYVNDSWKEARDMVIGDEVSSKKLVAIEDVEDGDVVHITIKDAHTYMCEGLLSHNKGIRIRPEDRLPPRDIGIGGGPGVPPKFPVGDRPLTLPPDFVCPDPDMNILMSDGSQKKAGDLVIGDLVKTHHEESFELGNYEVEHVDIINNVEKIKLIFDKNTIICSLSHKFYVGDSWKEAKDMVEGDVVSDNKLVAIESVENGDVVHITVKDAHTYICEGLLSHNKSPRIDPIRPRRPVGRRRPNRPVGRRMLPRPRPRPPEDDLGPPPEREVPIPKERLPRITRESDPRGPAPFAPNERAEAKDRFFERVFDRAEEAKQRKSMQKEERREVRQARNEERRARRDQPREINVGNERREIGRSMLEERAARRMQPGEIDVGGEIDINAERGGRRRRRGDMRRNRRGRRRDFTSRRSRMMGGRRGRSMEERAAFRDRYVSSLRGGFFS
tara:strand:- start:571 stop:2259 length:1689 start_codon:yes stop_codon:yes gene_type:complete